MIAPWLEHYWQNCLQALRQDRLSHALLISGCVGLGKLNFAQHFAQRILCVGEGDDACGQCQSCHWFRGGSHPDYTVITTEEDKKQIGVGQIRELTEALTKTSYGRYQVVIIHPSEAMNRAAANALLKTLEEPNGQVILLLVCDHPAGLLPTIRSRCQEFRVQQPPEPVALSWLTAELAALPEQTEPRSKSTKPGTALPTQHKPPNPQTLLAMADGLPMRALRLAESGDWQQQDTIVSEFIHVLNGQMGALKAAEIWSKQSPKKVLTVLATLVQDLIRLMTGFNDQQIQHRHRAAELHKLLQRTELSRLWGFWEEILVVKRRAMTNANPNAQLLFESLLLSYSSSR